MMQAVCGILSRSSDINDELSLLALALSKQIETCRPISSLNKTKVLTLLHLPPFLPPHFQPELQLINFIRIYHLIKFMREHHPMRYNRMTEILKMVSRTKSGFDNSMNKKFRRIKNFGESKFLVNQQLR